MQKNNKYIDLHIHSVNSDGFFSPSELVSMADNNNTKLISISDHDSINGLKEFQSNLKGDMIGFSGVEFSSYILKNGKRIKLHILGYGFDENNVEMKKLLQEMKEKRINAHLDLLNMVKEQLLSLPEESLSKVDMERYCWFDREFIKCLEQENYSFEQVDYYKHFFKINRFSYGTDYEIDVNRVIDSIHSANGFAVLAHPMAYKLDREDITNIILKLVDYGIDGIEVYQSDCNFEDSVYLNNLADKCNLLKSVGSDFHRDFNSDGRVIGKGINNNLCIEETTLTNKLLSLKKYYTRR